MACVMLHVELLKDLLSPQSAVRLSESSVEGVRLQGAHWQSIGDVKEAEGLLQLAAQNRAVHTLQADNGFLDACHVVTVLRCLLTLTLTLTLNPNPLPVPPNP